MAISRDTILKLASASTVDIALIQDLDDLRDELRRFVEAAKAVSNDAQSTNNLIELREALEPFLEG